MPKQTELGSNIMCRVFLGFHFNYQGHNLVPFRSQSYRNFLCNYGMSFLEQQGFPEIWSFYHNNSSVGFELID